MDAVVEILKGLDYSPLYVSLKTGIVATIFSFFLGLFAARRVIKAGPKVKAIADGILTLPMVLPPTAAGFFLLLLFSRRRPFGILLYEQFGKSCTDLGWLYHSSDRDRISADVQKCKSGIRTDRCESDSCGKNTWYAGI